MNNEMIRVLGSISPYCKDESNCPGYMYYDNEGKILLDCGFGVSRLIKMPDDLNNLTIVISHLHKDHYSDLFALAYASYVYHNMGMLDTKINVYIPEMLPWEDGYDDFNMIINNKDSFFNIITYNKDSVIKIGNKEISFCENHHSIKSFSTKIKTNDSTIVYTGDMGFETNKEFSNFSQNADLLICESTYVDSDNKVDENHLHAREAGMLADMSNVKTLMLTHFWPEHDRLDYVNEASEVFPNVLAAKEGTILNLSELKNDVIRR